MKVSVIVAAWKDRKYENYRDGDEGLKCIESVVSDSDIVLFPGGFYS